MTSEQIYKELKEIQDRIPKNLLKNAFTQTELTPTMKMVVDKAIEDPKFPEDKKRELVTLKESGEFNKTITKENTKVIEMINNFVNREIKKKIKAGLLPAKVDINQYKNEQIQKASDKKD